MSVVSLRGARAHVSDADLLTAIAHDDLGALGEIYDRYQADLRRVLHRVTSGSPDVDDLVQTTFLKLPSLAVAFDGRASARAWICGIGVRIALRHRRGLDRFLRRVVSLAQASLPSAATAPDSALATRQELRIFDKALGKLADKKRAVFVLIELEGAPAESVAATLGIPVATVRTRLFHAKAELREAMKRGGAW